MKLYFWEVFLADDQTPWDVLDSTIVANGWASSEMAAVSDAKTAISHQTEATGLTYQYQVFRVEGKIVSAS